MAIIQCRECGRDMSSEAKLCPHCGCPRKQRKRIPKKVIRWTLIVVALFLIVSAIAFAVVHTISLFVIDRWSEKDLCIYNSSGEVVIELHEEVEGHTRKHAEFWGYCDECKDVDRDDVFTYRGVARGDDALEALSKYNLDGAVYHANDSSATDSDIKTVFNENLETIVNEKDSFVIYIFLDDDFNTVKREPGMEYKYRILFSVFDSKISNYNVTEN